MELFLRKGRIMFVDKVKIRVISGKGGDGAVSFRREKYVPNGGPNGGDGGKGGDVIFRANKAMNTLENFRYKRKYVAQNGANGQRSNMSGKDGENIYVEVPVGTVIFDASTGRAVCDMTEDNQEFTVAKGGRGGRGNQHFATSTRQSPKFAKPGDEAEERDLVLELKTIADVGLIGFPNVGKSTILSMVTNATPKIANYHFTTLSPNLGIVRYKNSDDFILADIPGLIEGASEGQGLGHQFLRHVERTRLLVHVLDASGMEGRDPKEDFEIINAELENYSPELKKRKQIVVLNKTDLMDYDTKEERIAELKKYFSDKGYRVFDTSAAMRKGLDPLLDTIVEMLAYTERTPLLFTVEEKVVYAPKAEKEYEVGYEDGMYFVEGKMMRRLVGSVNLEDYESSMYFQRVLRNKGIFRELEELGIKDGDTVDIEGLQFEYYR